MGACRTDEGRTTGACPGSRWEGAWVPRGFHTHAAQTLPPPAASRAPLVSFVKEPIRMSNTCLKDMGSSQLSAHADTDELRAETAAIEPRHGPAPVLHPIQKPSTQAPTALRAPRSAAVVPYVM